MPDHHGEMSAAVRSELSGASDDQLIAEARAGGRASFGELWRRHYGAGIGAARAIAPRLDAEDLVAEAFARIFRLVSAGRGPTEAFRPYLYSTIRNLAARWGTSGASETAVEDIGELADPFISADPELRAVERTITVRAFRSLPERWRTVLWYTEVEGLDPHEVAPLLGVSANAVAALAYRAREGLRTAWVQAHISDRGIPDECRWAVTHLGEQARGSLSARDRRGMDAHLLDCARCTILHEEAEDLAGHLGAMVLPIVVGSTAASAWAAAGSPASVSWAAGVPAMPVSVVAAPAASLASPGLVAGVAASFAASGQAAVIAASLVLGVIVLPGAALAVAAVESATGESSVAERIASPEGSVLARDGGSDARTDDALEAEAEAESGRTMDDAAQIVGEDASSLVDGTLDGVVGEVLGGAEPGALVGTPPQGLPQLLDTAPSLPAPSLPAPSLPPLSSPAPIPALPSPSPSLTAPPLPSPSLPLPEPTLSAPTATPALP